LVLIRVGDLDKVFKGLQCKVLLKRVCLSFYKEERQREANNVCHFTTFSRLNYSLANIGGSK
jgi:hypothetical protein